MFHCFYVEFSLMFLKYWKKRGLNVSFRFSASKEFLSRSNFNMEAEEQVISAEKNALDLWMGSPLRVVAAETQAQSGDLVLFHMAMLRDVDTSRWVCLWDGECEFFSSAGLTRSSRGEPHGNQAPSCGSSTQKAWIHSTLFLNKNRYSWNFYLEVVMVTAISSLLRGW